jgi:hypothetical protein
MAAKSLVNESAETFGVAPPELDVALADEVALELELELDELPQPATSAAATSVGMIARFQPAIKAPPLSEGAPCAPS